MKNSQFSTKFNDVRVTVLAVPAIANIVSYSLIMMTYMNHVYNSRYPAHLDSVSLKAHKLLRNHNFAVFSFIGAPMIMMLLKKTSLGLKDVATITSSSETLNPSGLTDDVNLNKTGFFLFLSNFNKKLSEICPKWVK